MRQFDYSYLADRTWDNEIMSYISKIHEYKGKQELYLRQKPVELQFCISSQLTGLDVVIEISANNGVSSQRKKVLML